MAYDFSKLVLNKAGKIVLNKGGCVVSFIQNIQIPKNSILVEYSTDANESYINARYSSYEKEKINSRTYLFKLSDQQAASGISGFLTDSANTNPLRVTADLSDVKNAAGFCAHCSELVSVDIRNTQNIEIARLMFEDDVKLEHIPNIVLTKNVKDITGMFKGCYNIKSGILEFYNAHKDLESLESTSECFTICGVDENGNYASEQARLDRAQIPQSWGGDMPD